MGEMHNYFFGKLSSYSAVINNIGNFLSKNFILNKLIYIEIYKLKKTKIIMSLIFFLISWIVIFITKDYSIFQNMFTIKNDSASRLTNLRLWRLIFKLLHVIGVGREIRNAHP